VRVFDTVESLIWRGFRLDSLWSVDSLIGRGCGVCWGVLGIVAMA